MLQVENRLTTVSELKREESARSRPIEYVTEFKEFFVIKESDFRKSHFSAHHFAGGQAFLQTIDSSNHFLNRTANIIKSARIFCGFLTGGSKL